MSDTASPASSGNMPGWLSTLTNAAAGVGSAYLAADAAKNAKTNTVTQAAPQAAAAAPNTMLYVAIGGGVLLLLGVVLMMRK